MRVSRVLLVWMALAACSPSVALASEADEPRTDRMRLSAEPLTPQVMLEVVTTLEVSAEGEKLKSVVTKVHFNDGKGRTRSEDSGFVLLRGDGENPLTTRMFQPQGRLIRVPDPDDDAPAQSRLGSAGDCTKSRVTSAPRAPQEDLGTQVIHGVEATGKRWSYELPVNACSDETFVSTTELWRDKSGQWVRMRSSRSLDSEVTVTDYYSFPVGDLPGALFEVPPGAKVFTSPGGSDPR